MKLKAIMIGMALVLAAASCSTPKDVVYFQNANPGTDFKTAAMTQITVQPKDELFINVSCTDERLTDMFNLSRSRNAQYSNSNTNNYLGYLVDSEGNIDFPMLGKLQIGGMSREQIADHIKEKLQEADLVKDPVITVNFMNLGVVVLGEVARPTRVSINKDRFTLLDAIAQVGDLKITGKRENVKVIRNIGGEQHVYSVDLTNAEQVYSSPAYYLQQEDVIYVEPNTMAIRSSTVNGNTLLTYGFWMSLTSLIMSLVILIK